MYFERFQSELRRRPWVKHLIWLAWGTYTRDIEVMTLNNLGAMKLNLGRMDEAESHFYDASQMDPEAPLPHYNLATLEEMRGNSEKAMEYLNDAEMLGFSNTSYDKLVMAAGQVLANVEGRGIK